LSVTEYAHAWSVRQEETNKAIEVPPLDYTFPWPILARAVYSNSRSSVAVSQQTNSSTCNKFSGGVFDVCLYCKKLRCHIGSRFFPRAPT
jgi:hypothetical protein